MEQQKKIKNLTFKTLIVVVMHIIEKLIFFAIYLIVSSWFFPKFNEIEKRQSPPDERSTLTKFHRFHESEEIFIGGQMTFLPEIIALLRHTWGYVGGRGGTAWEPPP